MNTIMSLPLIRSFDCCWCESECFCSVPLFVLPLGLPGPRFSVASDFFEDEFSSKLRCVAGWIGFRLPECASNRLLLPGCWWDVGWEVLIWGLIWAVFGATLPSDFFLFRSET